MEVLQGISFIFDVVFAVGNPLRRLCFVAHGWGREKLPGKKM
jgi:hypothetical protein